MQLIVSIAACVIWLAIGYQVGRTEGRPVSGLLAALFGPIGLALFWAGRDRRRDRDARGVAARHTEA